MALMTPTVNNNGNNTKNKHLFCKCFLLYSPIQTHSIPSVLRIYPAWFTQIRRQNWLYVLKLVNMRFPESRVLVGLIPFPQPPSPHWMPQCSGTHANIPSLVLTWSSRSIKWSSFQAQMVPSSLTSAWWPGQVISDGLRLLITSMQPGRKWNLVYHLDKQSFPMPPDALCNVAESNTIKLSSLSKREVISFSTWVIVNDFYNV